MQGRPSPIMALRTVPRQVALHSASGRAGSADGCFSNGGDGSDLGFSSPSNQCSPDAEADDEDTWIKPQDMAILKALDACANANTHSLRRQPQQRIPRLTTSTCPLRLVGEGAANAVFEMKSDCVGAELSGMLLRVAKVPSPSHPPTYNYVDQQRFYQSSIKPLLGRYAVHQELVILHKSGIVDKLNRLLMDMDHVRKPKFRGSVIGQTDWGFLVEDMQPTKPEECHLIEFKPKWLSQSPSAPRNAVRCRQCALELSNLIQDPSGERPLPELKPCPLALVNDEAPPEVCSPFRIAPQLATGDNVEHYRKVLASIACHSAIRGLKTQQNFHDSLGPLRAQPSDAFLIAMTLRDCTCFAQISRRQERVKLRLGDFDWKDPQVKFDGWRRAEDELIRGGFYTIELIRCGGLFYMPPTFCTLEFPLRPHNSRSHVLNLEDRSAMATGGLDTHRSGSASETVVNHTVNVAALQKRLARFRIAAPTDLAIPTCRPPIGFPP